MNTEKTADRKRDTRDRLVDSVTDTHRATNRRVTKVGKSTCKKERRLYTRILLYKKI